MESASVSKQSSFRCSCALRTFGSKLEGKESSYPPFFKASEVEGQAPNFPSLKSKCGAMEGQQLEGTQA